MPTNGFAAVTGGEHVLLPAKKLNETVVCESGAAVDKEDSAGRPKK